MNNEATPLTMLIKKAENYSTTSAQLLKLNTIEKSADFVSSFASKLVLGSVVALFVLMMNIGVSFWIGEQLGKVYYGFFAVTGFYGLMGLVVYVFGDWLIKSPVNEIFINKIWDRK